jgi:hypothetical protein
MAAVAALLLAWISIPHDPEYPAVWEMKSVLVVGIFGHFEQ